MEILTLQHGPQDVQVGRGIRMPSLKLIFLPYFCFEWNVHVHIALEYVPSGE